jgi:sugar lactone lactonase YvrE
MAAFKTLQFLPEIFRTDSNRKFLNATVDQLVSEPNLIKVNSYIGRKLAPSYKTTDSYISEPTKDRQDYQLEPSIVVKDPITGELTFTTTYTDIVNKINFYGGLSNNHNRLFDSEYYSYDPHVNLDKFVNYAQYYWLEAGPDAVIISASTVPLEKTFDVTYDSITQTYKFSSYNEVPNPTITLARGGRYTFNINEPGNKFYIQTSPGSLGLSPNTPNLSTRSILGVDGNGQDNGTVVFQVPLTSAQVQWTSLLVVDNVNYATNLSYQSLQGCLVTELNTVLGGLDGPTVSLEYQTLIFVDSGYIDDVFWHNTARIDDNTIYLDQNTLIPLDQRNDIYQINVYEDATGNRRVYLTNKSVVNNEQRVRVVAGISNVGKEYYSRYDFFTEVPPITAPLDLLYYQSDQNNAAVGGIQLVDIESASINPGIDIVGQQNYTSPSGVVFTNGLKITFDSTVPTPYANNTYFVEGVGISISLVLVSNLISPELDNNLSRQDYFTINRASIDQNGWSRSNRWFHVDVIEKTAQYNNINLILDQRKRAQRPIIEFDSNLQLFNFGTESKAPVDVLDYIISNAYTQVQGIICASTTELTITVEGRSVTLTDGERVIFSQDDNLDVRNKIYNFSIELTTKFPETPIYRAYIEEADDATVEEGHTLIVKSGDNGQKQWYFNGSTWIEGQQKTGINQAPLFDVIDQEGISFKNTLVYPGTAFEGTKIFSYKQGTGTNDDILGFPLSYKNLVTQGDIQFENNFDLDTFSYIPGAGITETIAVNAGLLQRNVSRTSSIRLNTWVINSNFSKQYQIFTFTYDGTTNLFPVDILPDTSTNIPNIKVVVNKTQIAYTKFAITQAVDRLAIVVDSALLSVGDVVFISIFNSSNTSSSAYYQVPLNFDVNSLNTDLEILTLGQMRNHLIEYKNNSLDIVGEVPGKSNVRDLYFLNRTGSILQHSAPIVYAGIFLNHPTINFVNSLTLAAKEYSKFKIKFLELAINLELDRTNVAECVDIIITRINSVKTDTFPWHYSDMVPYGSDEKTVLPSYTIFDTDIRSYEITNIFQDTAPSNKAVFVYLTRTLEDITTTTLLVKGQDYYFDQTRPVIVIQDSFNLLYNDILTIVEYNNTDGSYVPETPTKLGLYPKYVPQIYTDNTLRRPTQVIQGHDGSLTPIFGDFRDSFLLELERRIYNNIKTVYNPINFNINDYIPGKFRVVDYSLNEFNQLLSQSFLQWAGTNRVDFTTNNTFVASDAFTWNYKKFRDTINAESLSGTWRSVFRYFFDTDRPHTHPWEMLGFSEKPNYWNDRYGPEPYTGGNFVLWADLESGYIHAGERAGIDFRYSRPGLTSFIPVDENGNLRPPSEFLVADFDSAKANTSFAIGDIGPAELAWRRSSDFPFAVQYALGTGKPARYFSLLADIENYTRSTVSGQFRIVDTNLHLQPTSLKVNGYLDNNGNIERSAGYLNWIRDYLKSIGVADAGTVIKETLRNLGVQLSYKMAGFSDKRFVEFLAEQVSPSSVNDSVVIPEENYQIELYKGAPVQNITYSAVIIEKTVGGFTVSGYDTTNPFFIVIPSVVNNNAYTIEVSRQRGVIYRDFKNQRFSIPYGFEFNTRQQIVDFLVGYQRFLIAQGFIFDDRDNQLNENKDWILSAKEFLHWSTQGWRPGNIIVLSPLSDTLKIFNELAVVDEVTNTVNGSRVLDINYQPIKKNNFAITRDSNLFTFKALRGETIGFGEFNLIQYEHIVVFDNVTVFNDVIYVPETGNRQYRLRLIGAKTGLWNGGLELPGYVYSSETVEQWNPGQDYLKGAIVEHKSIYYTALENISASNEFQTIFWQQIDRSRLKTGVVNNLATNATDALKFYDINDQPLDEKIQLFSNGLIGFRPRSYFTNLGIDVTTQSKFYQGLIKQKGTVNAITALKGAQFNNLNTDLDFFEIWAVRVGEYGASDINTYYEFALPESSFDNNPAIFQLTSGDSDPTTDITQFNRTNVYKISGQFEVNFLRTQTLDLPSELKPLPTAGFVNLDDVNFIIFDISVDSDYQTIVNNIGIGNTIWTAKDYNNQWNVFRATQVPGLAFILRHNVESKAELVMSTGHGLVQNDLIVLKNFDTKYNSIYVVDTILDNTRFLITIKNNLQDLIDSSAVISSGIVYKLQSSRYITPLGLIENTPSEGWLINDKIWVESLDRENNWGVFTKTDPWKYQATVALGASQYTGKDHFGRAIALDQNGLYLYGGAPDSDTGRVSIYARNVGDIWDPYGFLWGQNDQLDSFGKVLATTTVESLNYLAVAAPDSANKTGVVYIFENQVLVQILASSTGTVDDEFGASLAMSDDANFLYVGAPGADKVFCYALAYPREQLSQNITGTGSASYNLDFAADDPTQIIVTAPLRSSEYFPYIDYTVASGPDRIIFTVAPGVGERINVQKRTNYYKLLDTLPLSAEADSNSDFGRSVVCNSDGTTIAVGAPLATVNSVEKSGAVYVYHRTVTEFTTNGITNTFTFPDSLNVVYRVYLNGSLIYDLASLAELNTGRIPTYFTVSSNSIQYGGTGVPTLFAGNIIRVESNQFVFDQVIYPENTGLLLGGRFGSVLAMCGNGCNIYASSLDYVLSNYRRGAVTRYLNVGRVFGTITGTISNPTVTAGESLIINNREVVFSGTSLESVILDINTLGIPGVTASIVNNRLKITSDVVVAAYKLVIVSGAVGTPLEDLGLEINKYVQTILHPQDLGETFGISVKVDQTSGILAISSDGADISIPINIDSLIGIPTLFDSGGTRFVDYIIDSGAVYIHNLISNPYEDVDDPSLFAFTQKLVGPNLDTGFNFGASIDIKFERLVVGVANDYNIVDDGGSIYYYYNENSKSGWQLTRYNEPRVDIGAVSGSFIYNTVSQNILDFMDYIDPVKGKLLGVVEQELDYQEEYDPASYNKSNRDNTIYNTNFYWSDRQVGRTWWDLSTVRFIDYEQGILSYRAKNWGNLFPGSTVTIYEWVESEFLPSQYQSAVGDGIPKYSDNSAYSSMAIVDPVTGIISQRYYFWVSGKTGVDVNKARRTLSTTSLETYITNPKDQGIPYLALLAPNSVAVYNITDRLSGDDVVIHLDTATKRNTNLIHNEWQLVQQGASAESIPLRVINKLKDSLIGFDKDGQIVPDPFLTPQDKLGILNVPRQSLLLNRLLGLQNYVETLNTILSLYPILLILTPSKLFLEDPLPTTGFDTQIDSVSDLDYLNTEPFPDGYKILILQDTTYQGKWSIYSYNFTNDSFELFKLQSFKTNLFWDPIVWYDTTFQNGKEINYVVDIYSKIQALTLTPGEYIKVLDNGQGKWILYEVSNDGSLLLIGAEDGTLQVKPEVYDATIGSGYDSAVYDSIGYDPLAINELRNIYDSVYQEILVGEFSLEFNKLLLNIINFIFAEQKNPDWIFKTSFIDVFHNLRSLEQFPTYVRDNQDFYNDYINEVKPYRTQVKEYIPSYTKQDTAEGIWNDFDLPSAYDSRYKRFRSPDTNLSNDTELLTTDLYVNWKENYKYKVTDYIVGNVGIGYVLPPNVEITGGGGSGASAVTTLYANGQVSGITVISAGFGYSSTPNVFINGDGVGATAYPLLKNEFYSSQANLSYNLVRSIDTQIKFDRLDYGSNLTLWQPNTAYANTVITSGNTLIDAGNIYIGSGSIVVYNNQAYLATNANVTTESIFDFTRFARIDNGNVLLNALDRIIAYYSPDIGRPGKNINQLINGLEYPGTSIRGPEFRANAFTITSNVISFNYEGLTINSGNIAQTDFLDLGFEVNESIKIEANVPFDFQNNGYFTIVGVARDQMLLTGQPVESTYQLALDKTITANAGDYITQSNTLANAYVLQSVTNSSTVNIIYSVPEFQENAGAEYYLNLNGSNIGATIYTISTYSTSSSGGNLDVTIAYLDQQFVLDSNIYSSYLDTELGTRPQDINIAGGAYVDVYASHAPEELVPGRMYDALEIRVFSNTVGNTATYGFRAFQPMNGNIEYTRISSSATTTLSADLTITDDEILVADASVLPTPNPSQGTPGVIFINGERIHYYQKYDLAAISLATPWTDNAQISIGTLIALDSNIYLTTGNVYADTSANINTSNIQLITINSLRQIRRGVDGTGAANVVLSGNIVSDSSQAQLIPGARVRSIPMNQSLYVTNYVTYRLELTEPITANAGNFITQFSNANVRVLESVTNSKVVAVNLDSQPWRANLVTGTVYANLDINSQDTVMSDLFFKLDGTKMYTIGQTNDRVYEYTLGTAWDVATASNVAAVGIGTQEITPTGLFFKPDGTKMYVIGTNTDRVYEYTLSTPWQVNTASNIGVSVATTSGGTSETAPAAVTFRPDGSSYYIIGTGADRVKRYDMTTPWQVNTAAYYSQSAAITAIETTPAGLFFHPAGSKMFVVGSTNDQIREYDLATAWDPATITLVDSSSTLSGASPAPQGMFWKPDGTSVYIVDSTLNAVSEYQVVAYPVTGNTIAQRANIVSSTGTTNTTANVVSFAPLGSIGSNASVYVNQAILQSNIWVTFGNTLQYSTTSGAQFIRSEPSYIP